MSQLQELSQHTVVVADTGDIEAIRRFTPRDATTNPSLLFKAAQMNEYRSLVEKALAEAESGAKSEAERLEDFMDRLSVNFGREILNIVPGRVSTEVDAKYSFDRVKTLEKARRLIGLYGEHGVDKERVLIKIGATWEGIQAAGELEKEGIHTNLTLLFSFAQAVACAEAGVTLISPFVGRIYDWYKKDRGVDDIDISEDPGVESVRNIYNYYKKYGYKTEVMGASFRKREQVVALSGCDLLTISPKLLAELEECGDGAPAQLTEAAAKESAGDKVNLLEADYRYRHNQDAMGVEKLSQGIRAFDADGRKLEAYAQTAIKKAG